MSSRCFERGGRKRGKEKRGVFEEKELEEMGGECEVSGCLGGVGVIPERDGWLLGVSRRFGMARELAQRHRPR
jgi:hypothetical protein